MPEVRTVKSPYDAAIADVEAQIAELNTTLKVMKRLRDSAGSNGANRPKAETPLRPIMADKPGTTIWDEDEIRSDAFFKLTIGDAAVKYLRKWANRTPQATKAVIHALDRGGIRGKTYQTIYKTLTRRAKEKGDVVNVHGDWGLKEWYRESASGESTEP